MGEGMSFDGGRNLRTWGAGAHGLVLDPELLQWLSDIVDAMIPASDGWPVASDVGVPQFIESHADDQALGAINAGRALTANAPDATSAVAAIAGTDLFGVFIVYVYTGYYAAPEVVEFMRSQGSDYHGPPQPEGYVLERPSPVPATAHGSYIRTEEVRRVS